MNLLHPLLVPLLRHHIVGEWAARGGRRLERLLEGAVRWRWVERRRPAVELLLLRIVQHPIMDLGVLNHLRMRRLRLPV